MSGIGVGFRQEPPLQLAVFDAEFLSQFGFALLQSQALQIGGAGKLLQPILKTGPFDKGQAEVKLLAGSKERGSP